MTHSWLVFVESNTSGTGPLFAQAARKLGFQPVLLCKERSRYRWAQTDEIECHSISTDNMEELRACVKKLRSAAPIGGIVSSSEYFIETAAALAQAEGLPGGDPSVIARCRDKRRQRECLKSAGVPVPGFQFASSRQELAAAVSRPACPLVVKPAFGTGSIGVRLCRTAQEAYEHGAGLLERTVNERGAAVDPAVVVEDYLQGPEYSVELMGHSVIGITRKLLSPEPLFVEVGHDFPAEISDHQKTQLAEAAQQALAAIGLDWGPSHVELRVTPEGSTIIEINPRLAGGFIPELVRRAHDIDLIEHTLRLAAGQNPALTQNVSCYASIRFILAPAEGVLEQVDGVEEARTVPGVCDIEFYREWGADLSLHGDFRDRIGHVIAAGKTFDSSATAAATAHRMLRVRVSKCKIQVA
jgi:biotin carboxylase